jgi:hypothetical protein
VATAIAQGKDFASITDIDRQYGKSRWQGIRFRLQSPVDLTKSYGVLIGFVFSHCFFSFISLPCVLFVFRDPILFFSVFFFVAFVFCFVLFFCFAGFPLFSLSFSCLYPVLSDARGAHLVRWGEVL